MAVLFKQIHKHIITICISATNTFGKAKDTYIKEFIDVLKTKDMTICKIDLINFMSAPYVSGRYLGQLPA